VTRRDESFFQIEKRFHQLISQPDPVETRARGLASMDPGIWPLSNWIDGPDDAFAATRLEVYVRMHFARLHDSLKEDFPCLAFVVGAEAFAALIADYVQAHPSTSPSLRELGAALPAYLRAHPVSSSRPYLSDLCALEWARICVFDEPNLPILEHRALAELDAKQWCTLRLRIVPAFRLLKTSFAIEDLWQAADRGSALPSVERKGQTLLVWRRDFTVLHRAAGEAEGMALQAIQKSGVFTDVALAFATATGDVTNAAQDTATALRQWITDRLLLDTDSSSAGA